MRLSAVVVPVLCVVVSPVVASAAPEFVPNIFSWEHEVDLGAEIQGVGGDSQADDSIFFPSTIDLTATVVDGPNRFNLRGQSSYGLSAENTVLSIEQSIAADVVGSIDEGLLRGRSFIEMDADAFGVSEATTVEYTIMYSSNYTDTNNDGFFVDIDLDGDNVEIEVPFDATNDMIVGTFEALPTNVFGIEMGIFRDTTGPIPADMDLSLKVTFRIVPAPGAAAGLGLVGLVGLRRRRA